MAYRFVFETDEVFQGDICEAYEGFPANASELSGEAPPFATTTVDADRQVSVSPGERPAKGTVRRKFEAMLNANLNDALRESLPPGVKGTIWAVVIGTDPTQVDIGNGVVVTVVKTEVRIVPYLWSWEPLCPFESSAARSAGGRQGKHARMRSRAELDQLRDVRDRLLASTSRGQAHLRVYKANLAEIGKLLRTVPAAAGAFESAVARFLQDNAPDTTDPRLSPEGGELARELANTLLPHASPGLRAALGELLDQMGPAPRERRLRDLLAALP